MESKQITLDGHQHGGCPNTETPVTSGENQNKPIIWLKPSQTIESKSLLREVRNNCGRIYALGLIR